MPWARLCKNQDVKCAVGRHVINAADFEEDNPLEFSLSTTPKRGSRAFMQVLEGMPSSDCIIHDVTKGIGFMVIIPSKLGVASTCSRGRQ
jgi:hypothetical protein